MFKFLEKALTSHGVYYTLDFFELPSPDTEAIARREAAVAEAKKRMGAKYLLYKPINAPAEKKGETKIRRVK
jgi:hypothetical protein